MQDKDKQVEVFLVVVTIIAAAIVSLLFIGSRP